MVQGLSLVPYEEYGLERWYNYHSYISKLNMQAVSSAQTNSDEFVKEYFIANNKLVLLVQDLVALELWQNRVFKHLIQKQEEPSSTFPIYTVLYHELVVANLLETLTFHTDAMETLNDSSVDLADWCYRALCYLVANFSTEDSKEDYLKAKDEVWLSLFQILLANQSSLRYDCSVTHRRAALLKLRSHLTEDKIDVIPVLADLRRFLEHLSLSPNPGGTTESGMANVCLVEMMPEIRDGLCRKYAKKWKQLAIDFFDRIESDRGKQAARRAATQWTETFSDDHLDKLFSNMGDGELGLPNPYGGQTKCVVCGEPTVKRCSRCRTEWYCRRECQVKHWSKHKKACDLMVDAIKAEQEN
ncbi:unnamed protein product [Echinostoma caproni]|uniref:Zinc finger MYND domain-containing protein 10 n=1 Tax=Echinostoma caproni TaxID=27848 RepID=A0A183API2_9TREM|nr:unnamed protein product [Echinostoma caproni]